MPAQQAGPLVGVKVIELAHVMAGPVCGLMLADQGANVIKVDGSPAATVRARTWPMLSTVNRPPS